MSKDRPPAFQFYPRDFITDPVVVMMDLEARGAYINLLCYAWLAEDPGVLPDNDEMLARLSGADARWPAVRDAVRRAFRVQDGRLIQKRMVEVREEQELRFQASHNGGVVSASRPRDTLGRLLAAPQVDIQVVPKRDSKRPPPPASASASALEEEPNTLVPSLCSETPVCDGEKRTEKRTRSPQEKEPQGFAEFYAAYPRHEGRRAAAKQFALALKRRPEYTAADLKLAAEQFAQKSVGTEERFICLPMTWLSQDRWREYFDEDNDAQAQIPVR